VTMKTTVGDIELELWAKETPKAYRNFIQSCMEGYWDDIIFHTQGGDPTGTGEGGKIYGEPFKNLAWIVLFFAMKNFVTEISIFYHLVKNQRKMKKNMILNKKFSGEGKSVDHHLSDPKLSSQPAVERPGFANKKERKTAVVIGKVTTK
ncbi:Peptidyl-prolyl cis-trans isomerase CWC27 like protein, partial [Eufriesea mexicana]